MTKISRQQQRDMELVGTAPQPPTFVPAARERPQPVEIIMPGASAPVGIDGAFTPVKNDDRDSVSAQDRAKARLIDALPSHIAIVAIAAAGGLAFWRFGDVSTIDAFLAFLAALGVALLAYDNSIIRLWWRHSHAGIELARIDAAVQVHAQQMEAEASVRRDALALQLKLLEVKHDDE